MRSPRRGDRPGHERGASGSVSVNRPPTCSGTARRPANTSSMCAVSISVLAIDPQRMTADVEGMITYEALVDETLKYGLLPAVVPQLKTITVGGAVSGLGIESSSFKFGLVHETIEEMEILLGDGRLVTCSCRENPDLFFGFPNSYGTLGLRAAADGPADPGEAVCAPDAHPLHRSGKLFCPDRRALRAIARWIISTGRSSRAAKCT